MKLLEQYGVPQVRLREQNWQNRLGGVNFHGLGGGLVIAILMTSPGLCGGMDLAGNLMEKWTAKAGMSTMVLALRLTVVLSASIFVISRARKVVS